MYSIDIEKLRKDLINICGTAMFNGFPMAIINLSTIENAQAEKLIEIAKQFNVDLSKYIFINNSYEEAKLSFKKPTNNKN